MSLSVFVGLHVRVQCTGLSECLLVFPWISRLATSLECIVSISVWVNGDYEYCPVEHISAVYLTTNVTQIVLVLSYMSVSMYLDYCITKHRILAPSIVHSIRPLVTYSGNPRSWEPRGCCLKPFTRDELVQRWSMVNWTTVVIVELIVIVSILYTSISLYLYDLFSSTRDLLGLEVTPFWLARRPWLLLTRSCDSWLTGRPWSLLTWL